MARRSRLPWAVQQLQAPQICQCPHALLRLADVTHPRVPLVLPWPPLVAPTFYYFVAALNLLIIIIDTPELQISTSREPICSPPAASCSRLAYRMPRPVSVISFGFLASLLLLLLQLLFIAVGDPASRYALRLRTRRIYNGTNRLNELCAWHKRRCCECDAIGEAVGNTGNTGA